MLELKGIKKDYLAGENTVHALKGIDLRFRRNEFVSILGPSGCGKTTMLKIINGLIDFSAWGANEAGETIRPWQSGDVRQYAVWFITGTVALTLLLLCL